MYTIEKLITFLESLGHYKEITFEAEVFENNVIDSIYFNATNLNLDGKEVEVSIRADVQFEVSFTEWNWYECTESETDWWNIDNSA